MAHVFLLIDGYNLMHAAGMARERYGPGDLQRARERLLKFLFQRLVPSELSKTTIVFDSREAPPGLPAGWLDKGVQILFAAPTGDADETIEDLLRGHSAPQQLLLVSSDHRLQNAARRRRSAFIDSDAFVDYLETRPPPKETTPKETAAPRDPKQSGEIAADELAHWIGVFGELPTSSPPERRGGRMPPPEPSAPAPSAPAPQGRPAPNPAPGSPAKTPGAQPPSKSRKGKSPPPISPPAPPPFSEDWIDDLQHWVDEQE
jgi:hypothetical protein